MSSISLKKTMVLAALSLAMLPSARAIAQTADDNSPGAGADDSEAEAVRLYQEGTAALRANKMDEAFSKLSRSFELKPRLDTAANLAYVEIELGKLAAAANHLAYGLRVAPSGAATKEQRERMIGMLDSVKPKVARLTITVEPGTVVVVNDVTLGVSPVEDYYVDPGNVTVTGKHVDKGAAKATVVANAGESANVRLELKKQDYVEPKEREIWPAGLLGGLAGAGVALGIGFIVGDFLKIGEADDLVDTCVPPLQSCVTQGQDLIDEANTFRGVAIGGFTLGGLALIGMIVYLAIPDSPSANTSTTVRVVPSLGPTENGLSIIGTF